jgi:hypothetical protein
VTGEFHVLSLIDFKLGQSYSTFEIRQNLFQQWSNNQAGRTPVSPEIDQNRAFYRCLKNVLLKRLQGCIKYRHMEVYQTRLHNKKGSRLLPFLAHSKCRSVSRFKQHDNRNHGAYQQQGTRLDRGM